jgi:outer membrane PBP1 activator LpoA protein
MTDSKYYFIMPCRPRVCWFFALLWLAACASEPVKNQKHLEVKTRPQQPPQQQVKSYGLGDDLATKRILKADTLIQAGDHQAADKELSLVNQAELSPELRGKFNLLSAQINLSMGDAEQALQKLKIARPSLLNGSDKLNYYQSLAFANLLMGNVLSAVNARISLGNLLQQPAQKQANIAAILEMLGSMPESTLNAQPDMNSELNGWMALAKILKQRNQPNSDINRQIQQWRLAFPGHPANAEFLQAYLSAPPPSDSTVTAPLPGTDNPIGAHIAVLLPTTGSYASAGKAIKEGLQAAYRLAASVQQQLPLKFYDTAEDDIISLYNEVLAAGAQQVIGPLVKEQIQSLAQNATISIPVLALNHVENASQTQLYQFGLSPIDEAEALAIKARQDGRQSALILVPNTTQGQRIGNYLTSSWQSHGGTVAGIQSYDPKQHNVGEVFNQLIKSSSYPSAEKLSRALLLSANDATARELAPQLKYHQSTDLAVYAMPTIYAGHPRPAEDAELGSFSFCDMPWLFSDYFSGPLSQSALQKSWQGLPEAVSRLVALGVDAYNILGQLQQLSTSPVNGATGKLSINSENRITRKLVCAQYKGGIPVASGYAE